MKKAEKIADAIRTLSKAFDSDIILAQDNGVYLVAMVHTAETARTSRENEKPNIKAGTVEYMVSDGPPGQRSTSLDFTDPDKALDHFHMIAAEGWATAVEM